MTTPTAAGDVTRRITRDVVTPTTTLLFIVSTVTGLMLLLHWQAGTVRAAHEWLSLGFSAVAIWHLVKNWRGLLRYLHHNLALGTLAVGLAVCLLFTGLTASPSTGGPGGVFRALAEARLEQAAPVFGLTPAEATARLHAAGYDALASDTLAAIGQRAGENGAQVAIRLAATTP